MNANRISILVTLLNVVIFVAILERTSRPVFAQEGRDDVPAVLRTRSLELIDGSGRVRALLCVQPPARVDGKDFPETVLLRLIDPIAGPVVKLTASAEGSALGLSDDAEGGVQLYAKSGGLSERTTGNFVRVVERDGREQVLKP